MSAATIPIPPVDDPTPLTAWAYRHQARRLRCRFRNDPSALQRSLKALATREDASRPWTPIARPDRTVERVQVRVSATSADGAPAATTSRSVEATLLDIGATAAALQTPPWAVGRFSELVRSALDEGVLRHSRRQKLLRQAADLEIGPFEASLIIAAVEHRHTPRQQPSQILMPRGRPVLLIAAVLLAAEALLIAGYWIAG